MKLRGELWIVSELFYPDETATGFYMTNIAKHLAKDQIVNIICGSDIYEKGTKLIAADQYFSENVKIHRIKALSLDKNRILSRIFRFMYLTITLAFQMMIKIKRNDRVLLVTNPAFIVPLASFLSKIKAFELSILVHDVFPENLIPAQILKPRSTIYYVLNSLFTWAYKSSDRIIVLGRDMQELFQKKIGNENNKISVIENWSDIHTVFPIKVDSAIIYENVDLKDKVIFQYAGNIGRLQGLSELLDIISEISNTELHFMFLGEGAFKDKLILKANALGLSNVSFCSSFNRSKQNLYLNACDVAIVAINEQMFGLGVPSKSYNIMAAGKPILYIGNKNGEIGLLIKENNIGWQFEFSQKASLVNFFNQFDISMVGDKGLKSRAIAESKYSVDKILEKYSNLYS
ncbi:glycosyltransferase family 4 protein [Lacihabitans sp. CS3-21]|uniref:glycosyltransferase family 4 protein n=1 Tax=Lacihabitans sp. CS3-21 TaxID=2487332 RepID=UPI0020CFB2C0|nr:glycosyltransferase family 4 protein [Lacihabitans sp. CS3-21]MCP9747553.1 glycosyltransferase WbuB [Lacihabitans sp. CS3-21]